MAGQFQAAAAHLPAHRFHFASDPGQIRRALRRRDHLGRECALFALVPLAHRALSAPRFRTLGGLVLGAARFDSQAGDQAQGRISLHLSAALGFRPVCAQGLAGLRCRLSLFGRPLRGGDGDRSLRTGRFRLRQAAAQECAGDGALRLLSGDLEPALLRRRWRRQLCRLFRPLAAESELFHRLLVRAARVSAAGLVPDRCGGGRSLFPRRCGRIVAE